MCETTHATVYLDLETTGLDPPADDILEIAVVDHDGQVLLETLVRPEHVTAWPDTEALHGITPQDVEHAPMLETLRPQIAEVVRGKRVVIYNAAFDIGFLPDELAAAAEVRCCMMAFAEHYGEWSNWHGNYRWQSLGTAASFVRHPWTGTAHRAVADALACRAVWRYLTEPAERQRVEAIKQEEQLQRDADAHVRAWEREEERVRQAFEARMSTWWQWWWLKRPPLAPCRPAYLAAYDPCHRALQDAYAQVFTGYTLAVLEQVEQAEALGLPCYRRKRDIPPHLKPNHALRDQPTWVRAELRACAYYVSQRGRSFSWLYDVRHVETIRQAHVPRYTGAFPAELATKTQLRRAGVSQAVLQTLQPVAEYYRWLDHCWYPLYQRP